MTFAVVPAGGQSTRMGRPKLTLPLGERTVIEHVVTTLRDAGVDIVLVIVGPHTQELSSLVQRRGGIALALQEPTCDMRGTVEQGLRWLQEQYHPQAEVCWLLSPADHPAFSTKTVYQLLENAAKHAPESILVPVYQGQRGHPTLFRWSHVAGIRLLPIGSGINTYLQANSNRLINTPVDDSGIVLNVNTPQTYEELCRSPRFRSPGSNV